MSNIAAITYFTTIGTIAASATVATLFKQQSEIKDLKSKLKMQKSISDLYLKSMEKCLKKVHRSDRVFLQKEIDEEIAFFDIINTL